MKRILGMRRKLLAHSLAAILLGSASVVPVAGADNEEIVQAGGGMTYVSGGIGEESRARLSSLARDFNLKLVFAANSGEYVSGVRVAIANAAGKTLVDAMSEGPWFLTRLPAGNYQVVANFEGHAVKHQVAVGTTSLRTIDFRWAAQ